MNAIILGGMSQRHHAWVRETAATLEQSFEAVRFLDYSHWDRPDAEMNIGYEVAAAAELAVGMGEYVVVAKSIGSVVATLANAQGLLAPNRCVFLGFPLKVVREGLSEVAPALVQLPPTHFVHNENDPLGTAEATQAYIAVHAPQHYDFTVLPGDTHDYIDYALISQLAFDVVD